MDKQKSIQTFLLNNSARFPNDRMFEIEKMLHEVPENNFFYFSAMEYKDPTTMLIIAIFGGSLGIDRFLLEDTANGVLKLILSTFCLVGIVWVFIDCFNIQARTKEFNFRLFERAFRMQMSSFHVSNI